MVQYDAQGHARHRDRPTPDLPRHARTGRCPRDEPVLVLALVLVPVVLWHASDCRQPCSRVVFDDSSPARPA